MHQLLFVLRDTRSQLAASENDFTSSHWASQSEALAELDGHLMQLAAGHLDRPALSLLFAPTGSVQEVAVASGWGEEFLALAKRFDAALR